MTEPISYAEWQRYQKAWYLADCAIYAIPNNYSRIKRDLQKKFNELPEPGSIPYLEPEEESAPENDA